jgi:regulator of sigma E protease
VVGAVMPGSPAERVGLQRGDRLLTVAGDRVDTWEDLLIAIATKPERDVAITYLRDGQTRSVTVRPTPEGRYEIGNIGVLPDTFPHVTSVNAGSPAERMGLMKGDIVRAINGVRMATRAQIIDTISRNGERELEMTVLRGDDTVTLRGTPEPQGDGALLGFWMGERTTSFTPTPLEAVRLSIERNIESSGLIFKTLAGLFTGETSVRQLQGPVGIAQLSGESAAEGLLSLLSLMAMLSINLGILNLMPIPVLDGGHILILLLEGVARRDFSMAVKEKMLLAGFVVLMMLMVTVIYNDLTRVSWIEGLMPWRN